MVAMQIYSADRSAADGNERIVQSNAEYLFSQLDYEVWREWQEVHQIQIRILKSKNNGFVVSDTQSGRYNLKYQGSKSRKVFLQADERSLSDWKALLIF